LFHGVHPLFIEAKGPVHAVASLSFMPGLENQHPSVLGCYFEAIFGLARLFDRCARTGENNSE
jgi:hypothetical protein